MEQGCPPGRQRPPEAQTNVGMTPRHSSLRQAWRRGKRLRRQPAAGSGDRAANIQSARKTHAGPRAFAAALRVPPKFTQPDTFKKIKKAEIRMAVSLVETLPGSVHHPAEVVGSSRRCSRRIRDDLYVRRHQLMTAPQRSQKVHENHKRASGALPLARV